MIDRDAPTVFEAASWQRVAQLVRRHPDQLTVWHGHPGGGQSDVLAVRTLDADGGSIDVNRNGSIHVGSRFDGRPVD